MAREHPAHSLSEEVGEPVFRTSKSKKRAVKKNVLSSQHFSPDEPESGGDPAGDPEDTTKESGTNGLSLRFAVMLEQQEEQRMLRGSSPICEVPHAEDSCRSSQVGLPRDRQTPRSRRQMINHLKNPGKADEQAGAATGGSSVKRKATEVIQDLMNANRNVRSNTQLHEPKADPDFHSGSTGLGMVPFHTFAQDP